MDDADDGKFEFEEGNARESPVLGRRLAACDGCIAEGPEERSLACGRYADACRVLLGAHAVNLAPCCKKSTGSPAGSQAGRRPQHEPLYIAIGEDPVREAGM